MGEEVEFSFDDSVVYIFIIDANDKAWIGYIQGNHLSARLLSQTISF